ncbi:MAG: hypothetical protein LUD74_07265, partial [Tannerellaceae bacterium]|nr:hypothetical protein [Tannerellaceae bacterium]
LVRKRDMRKDAAPDSKLVYGQLRTNGTITFDELCEQIGERSTASVGDVYLVLKELVKTIRGHLKAGNIVQLDILGNFRPSAGCKGVEDEKDFHTSCFRTPRIVYTPGQELLQEVRKLSFEKLDVKTVTEECDRPHTI